MPLRLVSSHRRNGFVNGRWIRVLLRKTAISRLTLRTISGLCSVREQTLV